MSTLFLTLAALACPASMGAMMWMMMRGHRGESEPSDAATTEAEIARLQAEVDQLRAAARDHSARDERQR